MDILDLHDLEITPATKINSLEGWDSLTQINLYSSLAHEFSIKLTIDEVENIKTIADIVDLIREKR
jgi:acyl carrier protein